MPPLDEDLRRSGPAEERRPNTGGVADFPPPTGREVILRTTVPRPAPYSKPLPQRMYSVLTKEDFRLAGAFSADTTFFWQLGLRSSCVFTSSMPLVFLWGKGTLQIGLWWGDNTVVVTDSVIFPRTELKLTVKDASKQLLTWRCGMASWVLLIRSLGMKALQFPLCPKGVYYFILH